MRNRQARNIIHANDTLEGAQLDLVLGPGLRSHALGHLFRIRQVDHIHEIVVPEWILFVVTGWQHVRFSLVCPDF